MSIGFALLHRERTGEGQYIDCSLIDTYFSMHEVNIPKSSLRGSSFAPKRAGSLHPDGGPTGISRYRGQEFIAMMVMPYQWKQMVKAMNMPELADDPRFNTARARRDNNVALKHVIEGWLGGFPSSDAAVAALETERVPCAPVLTVHEAMAQSETARYRAKLPNWRAFSHVPHMTHRDGSILVGTGLPASRLPSAMTASEGSAVMNRVAVGLSTPDVSVPDPASRFALILDDDPLSQRCGEMGGERAGRVVGDAARWKRHHDGDRRRCEASENAAIEKGSASASFSRLSSRLAFFRPLLRLEHCRRLHRLHAVASPSPGGECRVPPALRGAFQAPSASFGIRDRLSGE
jgi:hypothetical protein